MGVFISRPTLLRSEYVASDGWTSNDTYDLELEIFAELREKRLEDLIEEERSKFEAQTKIG